MVLTTTAAAEVVTITVNICPIVTMTAIVFWSTNIAHYNPSIILLVIVHYSLPLLSFMPALFGCPLMPLFNNCIIISGSLSSVI
jgi:hypothetical protein